MEVSVEASVEASMVAINKTEAAPSHVAKIKIAQDHSQETLHATDVANRITMQMIQTAVQRMLNATDVKKLDIFVLCADQLLPAKEQQHPLLQQQLQLQLLYREK